MKLEPSRPTLYKSTTAHQHLYEAKNQDGDTLTKDAELHQGFQGTRVRRQDVGGKSLLGNPEQFPKQLDGKCPVRMKCTSKTLHILRQVILSMTLSIVIVFAQTSLPVSPLIAYS